ncbi:MAG: hypothetical protein AAGE88_22565 [Actinomycetota bacterium]
MARKSRCRELGVLAGLVVLIGAACSSGGGEASASPLEAVIGQDLLGDLDGQQDRYLAEAEAAQGRVASCMREAGFDYTPQDFGALESFSSGSDGLVPGEEEWVRRYGFGVSTLYFSQAQVGSGLVGYEDRFDEGDAAVDPNLQYYDGLTEAEQRAYDFALYGDESEAGDGGAGVGGCFGEAGDIGTDDATMRFFDEFGDEILEMFERMEADPRAQAFEQTVVECVRDRGFAFTDQEAAITVIEDRLADAALDPFDIGAISQEEFDALSGEEQMAYLDRADPELSDADKAVLGQIQTDEIDLAVAVFDCGGSPAERAALFDELRRDYEQQFVEANADRLDGFTGQG